MLQHASDPRPPALIMLIKAQVHMVGKHLRSVNTHVLIVSPGLCALYGCMPRRVCVCVCVAVSLYSFSRLARLGTGALRDRLTPRRERQIRDVQTLGQMLASPVKGSDMCERPD